MNPVRKALKALLSGDATLSALATGGVHWKQAPAEAEAPFVIFMRSSEVPIRTFDGPTLDKGVWMVKGVAREADVAESIDARCFQLLNNQTLNIEGFDCLDVHWIGVVDFAEPTEGERFDHVGHEYKIDIEREAA